MSSCVVFYRILFVLALISPSLIETRRYDVAEDAQNTYGEDFNAVLKRFRRSPEYLKILNDRLEHLKYHYEETSTQILSHYYMRLKTKIINMYTTTTEKPATTTQVKTTTPISFFHHVRRQEGEVTQLVPTEATSATTTTTTEDPVKALDNYRAFQNVLTITERNNFRAMGFECAGQIIHEIIKHMGPVDDPIPNKSTKILGLKAGPRTTEHPIDHVVTPETTTRTIESEETTLRPSEQSTFPYFGPRNP